LEIPFSEVHILWITAGLGCDGDSVAITAATQPSLEDLVQGIIPGIPTVHFHNPLLATENGEAFMRYCGWRTRSSGTSVSIPRTSVAGTRSSRGR
jgi:Ni,Fe-hydrogenase I small subunit